MKKKRKLPTDEELLKKKVWNLHDDLGISLKDIKRFMRIGEERGQTLQELADEAFRSALDLPPDFPEGPG